MKSLRNQDMGAEEKLGEFMDAYFCSRLVSKNDKRLTVRRMKDRESQLRGNDVLIETEGRTMIIDEKASLYYSNAIIPTFAFELDSIQEGNRNLVQGWFVNDELETEYYMLIWPNVKCEKQENQWIRNDVNRLQREDFTIIEAFLISKMGLREEPEK